MKITQKKLPFPINSFITNEIFTEHAVFFDIETTGFSPRQTSLYLIGCAHRDGDMICLDQFFAEKPEEEKSILSAFLKLLHSYHTIITYNGIGFDIPYLRAKFIQYALPDPFVNMDFTDLFKAVSKYKHIFKLPDYKQKSIEQYLGITRNDLYSGGELIHIYQTYINQPSEDLLHILLLNNYEDILGMIDIIPILSYQRIFQGTFQKIASVAINEYKNYDGISGKELIISIIPDYTLPQKISCLYHDIYFTGNQDTFQLAVPIFSGTLKYFYPNYKDYYYLPAEDTAIHKSVAAYVEKSHREQAKASTCYGKKEACFLPQFSKNLTTPAFFKNYGDKMSYFEYSEQYLKSPELLAGYAKHLLVSLSNVTLKY